VTELELHDNVQFIYELSLARLELAALGVEYELDPDLRRFRANGAPDAHQLIKRLAYFKTIQGRLTDYHFIQRQNVTRSVNQYLTHWFYPYKGKYHPQMIRALLNIIGVQPGEAILDPFIGSGTTALECQLLGIDCIGIDVSPLCVAVARSKTQSLDVLPAIKDEADSRLGRSLFTTHAAGKNEDDRVCNFFTVARMIAESDRSRRRKDFNRSLEIAVRRMIESLERYDEIRKKLDLRLGKCDIREGDARRLDLADESVDGIICSPPYSIALNYVVNDAHALKALGYDLDRLQDDFIGVRGRGKKRFDLYDADMAVCAREMYRVLKPGRYCVVVIGNVSYQGEEVDTTGMFIRAAEAAGFRLTENVQKIIFGLYNVMQREWILIFRK